jgi:hypothetical protein
MRNTTFKMNANAALLGLIAAAYPVIGSTAPAARVDFTMGDVQAIGPGGQSRNVTKGAQIEQGETIATNNGRAQLRFTDGAYVSLQPQSEFRIDQYRFEGKQDGNEKGFFSLLKGGLRTVTGLVGRNNKGNYQVNTSVATIGIRGTEYTIQYGQSIVGTVGEGEINVCNGAGCLSVTNGESYYVQSQEIKPVLTNKRTDLPPPSPQNPPSTFAQGETVNESGDPCVLFPATCGGVTPPLTGTFSGALGYTYGSPDVFDTTATLDNGKLLSASGIDIFGTYQDVGGDDIIAWGRASTLVGGEFQSTMPLHYVFGQPATDHGSLSAMQGTYTLMGATRPTGINDGAVGGTLNSMSMTANFQTGNVSGSMSWTLENKAVAANFSGGFDGTPFFASGSTTNGSGSVSLQGFVAGANGTRAGVVYSVQDFMLLQQAYTGAAALKQTSLGAAPPLID